MGVGYPSEQVSTGPYGWEDPHVIGKGGPHELLHEDSLCGQLGGLTNRQTVKMYVTSWHDE